MKLFVFQANSIYLNSTFFFFLGGGGGGGKASKARVFDLVCLIFEVGRIHGSWMYK